MSYMTEDIDKTLAAYTRLMSPFAKQLLWPCMRFFDAMPGWTSKLKTTFEPVVKGCVYRVLGLNLRIGWTKNGAQETQRASVLQGVKYRQTNEYRSIR